MATATLSVDQITQGFPPIPLTVNNVECMLVERKSYEEMARAQRNAEYLAKLDRGFAQMKDGRGQVHDLIEVDDE